MTSVRLRCAGRYHYQKGKGLGTLHLYGEGTVFVQEIQEAFATDDADGGVGGVSSGLTGASGMYEESIRFTVEHNETGKGCHVLSADIGAITLGLDGYTLAVNDNPAIYAAISGIPMVMDNFVTLALEGIKKEFLKDIGIDVSEIGQQLCRGILFFPCIDAMVYLLCPANIPLMSFLPEKEMPSSCKEDEKQGYTNNEGGLYHLFLQQR